MDIEHFFLPYFQKNISIILDNKIIRQGKLLLFCIKDFYLHFTIVTNNVTRNFEIPYPFNTYIDPVSSQVLILDYKIRTFTKQLPEIEMSTRRVYNNDKKMKYFDSVVKLVEST